MDTSCVDLEFFDLSNASDEEVKEIRSILSDSGSNGCVELPWEIPLPFVESSLGETETVQCEKSCEPAPSSTTASSNTLGAVVGQALLYAPPAPQIQPTLPAPASEVLPHVEAFMPQMPPMSAASAIGPHYPAPYLVPRTLPYLRAYPPHVGVPLFTCTLPSAGELTHVASPYTPFLPVAAPLSAVSQPPSDKSIDSKENSEVRHKNKGSGDRQFYHHHSRKKNVSSGNYYSSPDFVQGVDAYQDSVAPEDQTLASGNEHLSAVPSSLPVVPVPVPPSTFSVTSGALPMPSYPPGLHPLHYSQISGPQPPTTPVYYLPVFNHPHYSSYIPSASGHMMLPIGNVTVAAGGMHPTNESECSAAVEEIEDVTKSCESLAASVESDKNASADSQIKFEKSPPSQSDDDVSKEEANSSAETVVNAEINNDVTDSHSQEGSDTLTESQIHTNPKADTYCDESVEKIVPQKVYNDSSRCWADLFKKQCPEVNGIDRRSSDQPIINDTNLTKEITNGKMYSVPNSDNVL